MTPFVFSQPQIVWTLCVFTACSFLFLLSAFWLCRKQPARLLDSLCLCQQTACDEEGVRLAFGKSSSANLDPSEEEIDRYFKHKQSHNIEHARHLGLPFGRRYPLLPSGAGIFLPYFLGIKSCPDAVPVCHRGLCPPFYQGFHPSQSGSGTD